jgi:Helix-loop-helix DNA-binding domain
VSRPFFVFLASKHGERRLSWSRAMIANEKRRRRRESHNAVERRRRDNINEKISELATLIPECMLDASGMRLAPFLSSFP